MYILDSHRSPSSDCDAVQSIARPEIIEPSDDFECFFEHDFGDFNRIREGNSASVISNKKSINSTDGFEVSSPGDIGDIG